MKSKTETIAVALRILSNDIQSPDDVPATCLREAADRLEELQEEIKELEKACNEQAARKMEYRKEWGVLIVERDEARAEIERLKAELHKTIESDKLNNLQPKTTRPEPSRLEIAAMLKAGWFCNFDNPDALACPRPKWWIEQADALIAAEKEAK